ncbi:MAG: hypothetical protein FWH52_05625 [Synergistaceae bacterium]|nr:hypothetical protein [Synergistaceae bacterium]
MPESGETVYLLAKHHELKAPSIVLFETLGAERRLSGSIVVRNRHTSKFIPNLNGVPTIECITPIDKLLLESEDWNDDVDTLISISSPRHGSWKDSAVIVRKKIQTMRYFIRLARYCLPVHKGCYGISCTATVWDLRGSDTAKYPAKIYCYRRNGGFSRMPSYSVVNETINEVRK